MAPKTALPCECLVLLYILVRYLNSIYVVNVQAFADQFRIAIYHDGYLVASCLVWFTNEPLVYTPCCAVFKVPCCDVQQPYNPVHHT